jgi:hypothetical protein
MLSDERNGFHYDNNGKKCQQVHFGRKLPACLCGRQILAARDEVLRMSVFSVGQAFDARWSSYLFRSRRARPADNGLHLLLHWRNVSYITRASPPSHSLSVREMSCVLVCGSGGGGVICA